MQDDWGDEINHNEISDIVVWLISSTNEEVTEYFGDSSDDQSSSDSEAIAVKRRTKVIFLKFS